jgi:2-haloacid dehalogenase
LTAIDTVVFDLGEVLIPWDPRKLYRQLIPDAVEMERFLSEVCSPEWNTRQDAGRPLAEGTAQLVAAYPHYQAWIRAFYDRWPEMLGEVVAGSALLVQELKAKGFRVLALTNWSAETFPFALQRYPILSAFEGVLVSGREGLVKPEAAIYRLLCERFQLVPERVVFIDDSVRNVQGARAIGMQAIQFRSPGQVRDALVSLGLPL